MHSIFSHIPKILYFNCIKYKNAKNKTESLMYVYQICFPPDGNQCIESIFKALKQNKLLKS